MSGHDDVGHATLVQQGKGNVLNCEFLRHFCTFTGTIDSICMENRSERADTPIEHKKMATEIISYVFSCACRISLQGISMPCNNDPNCVLQVASQVLHEKHSQWFPITSKPIKMACTPRYTLCCNGEKQVLCAHIQAQPFPVFPHTMDSNSCDCTLRTTNMVIQTMTVTQTCHASPSSDNALNKCATI